MVCIDRKRIFFHKVFTKILLTEIIILSYLGSCFLSVLKLMRYKNFIIITLLFIYLPFFSIELDSTSDIYYFTDSGVKIAYKIYNESFDNTPILFFYGFCGNIKMVDYFSDYLAKENPLIVVDYMGHGFTPVNFDVENEEFCRLVATILKSHNYNEVNLVGYSFGGIYALMFYNQHEIEIKKLALIHTTSNFTRDKFKKSFF